MYVCCSSLHYEWRLEVHNPSVVISFTERMKLYGLIHRCSESDPVKRFRPELENVFDGDVLQEPHAFAVFATIVFMIGNAFQEVVESTAMHGVDSPRMPFMRRSSNCVFERTVHTLMAVSSFCIFSHDEIFPAETLLRFLPNFREEFTKLQLSS